MRYIDLLLYAAKQRGVVSLPDDESCAHDRPSYGGGLRQASADAHRCNTGFINARNRWTGHLWQGHFGAVMMDETHLASAVRYVSLNPVRARLVERAGDWPWSSVRAHLAETDDALVRVTPVLDRYRNFADFLGEPVGDADAWRIRQCRMGCGDRDPYRP